MGAQRFTSINPVNNYARMFLHRRLLGHLSAVYCVAFDRTGLRIFTVSETPEAELRAARLRVCIQPPLPSIRAQTTVW